MRKNDKLIKFKNLTLTSSFADQVILVCFIDFISDAICVSQIKFINHFSHRGQDK
ncbi:hypothetical protein pb186bvf_001658 [Paramecium bursaria]